MHSEEVAAGGDAPADRSQAAELEEGLSSPLQPLISSRSTLSVEHQSPGSVQQQQQQQPWAGKAAEAAAAAAGCPGPGQFAWVSTCGVLFTPLTLDQQSSVRSVAWSPGCTPCSATAHL